VTGFAIVLLIVVCVALLLKIRGVNQQIAWLEERLRFLETDVHRLATRDDRRTTPERVVPPPLPPAALVEQPIPAAPARMGTMPLPPSTPVEGKPAAYTRPAVPPILTPPLPPPPAPEPRATVPSSFQSQSQSEESRFEWESFLGVKLFAWIAGLALFLAAVFFVKHAFEHDYITPRMRVLIGAVTGLGLIAGGLWMPRARHVVTVQTLCATGILVLYADCFAAHAYYRFLDAAPTFALMTVITVAAFALAVRLDAQVIAVLGLLGGFLTPPLLSTGVDRPVGLFGYLGLLDAGLIAVALRKRWNYLVALAAAATVFMQWSWVWKFFVPAKVYIALTIFLGFAAMFVVAFSVANRRQLVDRWVSSAAALMPAMAMAFALFVLVRPYAEIANRVWLLFGYVFLADAALLALVWLREEMRPVHLGAGCATFGILALWTMHFLSNATLNVALGAYLLFALLHAVFPLVLQRFKPSSMSICWAHLYPILALLLVLFPLAKLASSSLLVWPVVLLIDLVAIVMAVLTASLLAILAVFVLTVVATALWITQLPPALSEVPGMLVVIGGFAVFFMAASALAARKVFAKLPPAQGSESTTEGGQPALTQQMFSQICSLAEFLPYLLLTMVVLRLPLANPAPVFAIGASLLALKLAMARTFKIDLLPAVGLAGGLVLHYAWHFAHFMPERVAQSVGWYLGFSALVMVFPFLFRSHFENRVIPWAAAALALPLHYFIIHRAIKAAAPDFGYMGLLPAVLAVPCLLGLLHLVRAKTAEQKPREAQLALFGAAALFFVTLIIPIQFDRQWITIGWALEGTALLWLFRRVPHPGLRAVGVALLVTSFARLALNPWIITGYGRTGIPIWNWYLYAYGIVTACLLAGAKLLAPPRDRVAVLSAPPLLYSLGTVLAFLLLNIEIADSFTPPGERLTFRFSANFGQDMTYSLGWALFAFVMLSVGFRLKNAASRYAGMALLMVTLLKLFLHDVWRLGGLFRIGSLFGLAVVLLVVSLIYQRFLSGESARKEDPSPN